MMRGKASFFGADIQALARTIEPSDSAAHARRARSRTIRRRGRLRRDGHDAGIELARDAARRSSSTPATAPAARSGCAACARSASTPDPLFCEMDGRFPNHHPDPTVPKNLEALIARVKATGAASGIAYDGDADRLGAVDANGEIIWGDQLMILFSRALLAENPGAAILGEVKCSQTLYDDIAKHGGRGHHVEDGPLAHQDEDEGGGRAARRRDERPPLLRRSLLRLRRRASTRRCACSRSSPKTRAIDRRDARRRARNVRDARDARRLPRRDQVRRREPARRRQATTEARRATRSSTSTARASRFDRRSERRVGARARARTPGRVLVMRFEARGRAAERDAIRSARSRTRSPKSERPRSSLKPAS